MTRAWHKATTYDADRGSPEAWLVGILRFVALEQGRSNRPDPTRLARLVDVDPGPAVDGHLLADEEASLLRTAFARLGDDDREVLELRVVARLSAEDAGAVLGRSAGAVRMAQSRALVRLRSLLEDDGG